MKNKAAWFTGVFMLGWIPPFFVLRAVVSENSAMGWFFVWSFGGLLSSPLWHRLWFRCPHCGNDVFKRRWGYSPLVGDNCYWCRKPL
jgi:hypothetical protein